MLPNTSFSQFQFPTSSCSRVGVGRGRGRGYCRVAVGVTARLCRRSRGVSCVMWNMRCLCGRRRSFLRFRFVLVMHSFVGSFIHSYIHSVTFISFHCFFVPRLPLPTHKHTHTYTTRPKAAVHKAAEPLEIPLLSLPSRVKSFGLLFRVLPSSFCQVFLPLLPFVVN